MNKGYISGSKHQGNSIPPINSNKKGYGEYFMTIFVTRYNLLHKLLAVL